MFNLIQGIFYSEHDMTGKFDDKHIIKTIKAIKKNPELAETDDRPVTDNAQHTFYEDTNLTWDIYDPFVEEVTKVINDTCETDAFDADDVWGHVVEPLQQTMVHSHRNIGDEDAGLSCVYYPHMKKGMGNIHFIVEANNNRIIQKVNVKPKHLYVFSRDVLHFTPANTSNQTRVSISANFLCRWSFLHELPHENNFWRYVGRKGEAHKNPYKW